MTTNRCQAKTKVGRRCGAPPLVGDDRCFNHAAGLEAESRRLKARQAGGRARGEQIKRSREEDDEHPDWWKLIERYEIEEALAHVARQTIEGRMGAREASAATMALKLLLMKARG